MTWTVNNTTVTIDIQMVQNHPVLSSGEHRYVPDDEFRAFVLTYDEQITIDVEYDVEDGTVVDILNIREDDTELGGLPRWVPRLREEPRRRGRAVGGPEGSGVRAMSKPTMDEVLEVLKGLSSLNIEDCPDCESTGEDPLHKGDACRRCGGCGEITHAPDVEDVREARAIIAKAKNQ